jgi:hypothetical protein
MTFLMCHLKSLIFDCISFTEGLITSLFNISFLDPDMKKNHFSSQILLKLTFSDSVQSHD